MKSQVRKCAALIVAVLVILSLSPAHALGEPTPLEAQAGNPYGKWQTDNNGVTTIRCTWFAWQEAHDRLGVDLPGWTGNAWTWYDNAAASGYQVGSEPRENSVAVFSDGGWGHVAFVTGVSGSTITVNEGGWTPNAGVNGGLRYGGTYDGRVGARTSWGTVLTGYIYLTVSHPSENIGDSVYALIQNQSSGKYLTNAGGNVVGADASGGGEQLWHFVRQGDGSYLIQSGLDLSVMDVNSLSGQLGANVYVNGTFTGNANQRFYIYLKNNAYYFAPAYGGYHLDLSQSTYNLEIWGDSFDGGPQAFSIIKLEPSNVGDDFYANVVNKGSGKYLANVGGNVVGADASGGGEQLWHFVRQGDGSYLIQSGLDLSVMDVEGLTGQLGANVYVNGTFTGNANQRFFVYSVGGSHYLSPAYGGYHLDLSQSTYNLEIWGDAFSGNGTQEFEIRRVDPVNLGDDFYANVVNKGTGKYLANVGGNVAGADASGGGEQLWHFVRQGDGSYLIQSGLDLSVMDVEGLEGKMGANVYPFGTYTGNANQRFFVYSVGGSHYLSPAYGGYHLDLSQSTYNLEIWGDAFSGNGTQEFEIRKVSVPVTPSVSYRTHVQSVGWQAWTKNGATAGTSGRGLRLEALEATVDGAGVSGSIQYRTHVQGSGWESTWRSDGQLSGTSGKGLRLEALQARLTGALAERYDLWYRVHAQSFGWMGWAKNGASAGTAGYGYRLEALELRLVEKGGTVPGETAHAFRSPISYQTHVQSVGWQGAVRDGATAGTSGRGLRLEALRISLPGAQYAGSVQYRTHVQRQGWQGWVADGELSGTSGKGLRLEAVEIRLAGEMARHYDIYYRVHAQSFGWMGWAKNGASAGTAGYGYRLEALELRLVEKDGTAPGVMAGAFREK